MHSLISKYEAINNQI